MRIVGDLIRARFIKRTSRFTVVAEKDGRLLDCFLANPGRLKELMVPGNCLLLRCAAPGGTRRTGFDVMGVCLNGKIVTVDSRVPNALIEVSKQGYRCVIIFVVQRDDARVFKPNSDTDPEFSKALQEARSSGVEAIAYTARYEDRLIELVRRIRVEV